MPLFYKPRGHEIAVRIIDEAEFILNYYDPDADGVIAGELSCRYLDSKGRGYSIHINNNRKHGLMIPEEKIPSLKGWTIVLVDAGVTRAQVQHLVDNGISIVVMDHHHIDETEFVHIVGDTAEGCIINNQYPFEPEEQRYLSGAGVVYHTLMPYSEAYGADEVSLVGLSLLTDVRPIDNPLAQQYLQHTYTHMSPYIRYLVSLAEPNIDYGFGVQTLDRNFIDYTFAPKINALFRLDKGMDAIILFRGHHRDKDVLTAYRGVQNHITDNMMSFLKYDEHSDLVIASVSNDIPSPYPYSLTNFIGLAASRVLNQGKTVFLFITDAENKILRGSVRGVADGLDYLSVFRKNGFEAEGHAGAFGVMTIPDQVDYEKLNQDIRELEDGFNENKYRGRVLDIKNLSMFISSSNSRIADYNNYVRDHQRLYLRYKGGEYTVTKNGSCYTYVLDDLEVLSFTEGLTPSNGLILPIKERGKYITFYLKQY